MVRYHRLITVAVFVGIAFVTITGAIGSNASGSATQQDANPTVAQSSGAEFAGEVSLEGATLENELQQRTLNQTLQRAHTPAGRIAIINRSEITLDQRLDSLKARSARLATNHRTGQIEEDRYRAESGVLKTRIAGISHRIMILQSAVRGLPTAQRDAHKSLGSELDRLAKRAHALDEDNDNEDVEDDDSVDDDDHGDAGNNSTDVMIDSDDNVANPGIRVANRWTTQ